MPDNAFTRIPLERIDADSPVTEELADDLVSNQNHNLSLIRGDGEALANGTVDTVTDVANSVVTDAAPAGGAIANILVGHVIEMVDGAAKGVMATVTVAGSGSTFTVNANLDTAGVLAGDEYRILYGVNASDQAHTHDGIDSPPIDADDIVGIESIFEYTEAGRSKSATRSGTSGTTSDSHTISLPTGSEDYFVWGHYHVTGNVSSSSSSHVSANGSVTPPNQDGHNARWDIVSHDSITQHDRVDNTGAMMFIAQDGDSIGCSVTLDDNIGSMTAKFTIEAYQLVT